MKELVEILKNIPFLEKKWFCRIIKILFWLWLIFTVIIILASFLPNIDFGNIKGVSSLIIIILQTLFIFYVIILTGNGVKKLELREMVDEIYENLENFKGEIEKSIFTISRYTSRYSDYKTLFKYGNEKGKLCVDYGVLENLDEQGSIYVHIYGEKSQKMKEKLDSKKQWEETEAGRYRLQGDINILTKNPEEVTKKLVKEYIPALTEVIKIIEK